MMEGILEAQGTAHAKVQRPSLGPTRGGSWRGAGEMRLAM